MKKRAEAKFSRTAVTNLLRHNRTGVYYARVVHKGRQHWKSLGVTSVDEARPLLAAFRASVLQGRTSSSASDTKTFGDCAAVYEQRLETELIKKGSKKGHPLSQGTKEFRIRPGATLQRTWPSLWKTEIGRISSVDCQVWLERFSTSKSSAYTPNRAHSSVAGNSPTVTNACIGFLRRVFAIGIEKGHLTVDPAKSLERKAPNQKDLNLPNMKEFAAIVAKIREGSGRCPDDTADLVEGLAYTGMRLSEATSLTWANVKEDEQILVVRADPRSDRVSPNSKVAKGLKTKASLRDVPLLEDMRGLLARIPKTGPYVFRCHSALGSLKSACSELGLPVLTHHDLRHLFATTCLKNDVDIKTISRWLGHSDGGVLAMQTYLHFDGRHSKLVAAKVTFSPRVPAVVQGNIPKGQPDQLAESPTADSLRR